MADIIAGCEAAGLRVTDRGRVVARGIGDAEDPPGLEALSVCAAAVDPGVSRVSVCRTVTLFEAAGILEKHGFGDGRARTEGAERDQHDRLIDVATGQVIEFVARVVAAWQERIAMRPGFGPIGNRREPLGVTARKN